MKPISTIILILLFSSIFGSCQNTEPKTDNSLNQLAETEVLDILGEPERDTILIIIPNAKLLEYQGNLYKLSENLDQGEQIEVKEIVWFEDGKTTVVWLKNENEKWISFDNLNWTSNIQF